MRRSPRSVPQMVATLGIVAVAILAFVVYVGRNAGGNPGTAATPTPSSVVSAAGATCGALNFGPVMTTTGGNAGKHTYSAPPPMTINTAHHFLVTMTTNKGTIHRVVADFVIQGGDPLGTGGGGPGYKFNDEPVLSEYTAGAVAMANSGANTNGSQFFICTVDDTKKLAKSYNLFGYVQSGMDVALKIAQGDTMTSVTVQEEIS